MAGRAIVMREVLLVALVISAVLLGELHVLRATWTEYLRSAEAVDEPRRIEQMIDGVDDVLPPHGYIGYINPDHSWLDAEATRTFYLSQYAIAPRVLVTGTWPEYVIYFSHRGKPLTPDAIPPGMKVIAQRRTDLAVLGRSK